MKTHGLLYCLLIFITCCILTWKGESTFCAVLAYISLVAMMVGVAKNLIGKLDA